MENDRVSPTAFGAVTRLHEVCATTSFTHGRFACLLMSLTRPHHLTEGLTYHST
jgi:hypothetical protein